MKTAFACFGIVSLLIAACGDGATGGAGGGATGVADAAGGADGATGGAGDVIGEDGAGTGAVTDGTGGGADGGAGGGWTQPEGAVAITFWADDSKNETYQNGQIQWTGSFAWDPATNLIEPATSWLPDERAWPTLYDDGPISAGGHEAEGQSAGDHVFSTEVFLVATEETSLEYGALNEFGRWIWQGQNGQLVVPAGATGRLEAGGVTFAGFGDRDLKLAIDLGALHPEFSTITAEDYRVYVKGQMNSWTPVQILDDGQAGDDSAQDGIFTYLHSTKLGEHDGLVAPGQHVQFVFVFAFVGDDPDEGLEYKFPADALPDGVLAWTGAVGGELSAEAVVLEAASDGKVKNTAVVVSGAVIEPACSDQKPCAEGFHCLSDTCVVCGAGFPCGEGFECSAGSCVATGAAAADPAVSLVYPDKGAPGAAVTISGVGFQAGAVVTFGQAQATGVEVKSPGTIVCVTPEHGPGAVTVSVKNPDGGEGGFPGGFTYTDKPAPTIGSVSPDTGENAGGTAVTVSGSGFQTGATVFFGVDEAGSVLVFVGGGSLTCTTPATSATGPVDVTVQNPDGQSDSKIGAFTYEPGLVNWATLEPPFDVAALAGTEAGLAHARAYHPGVTDQAGQGGLLAQLGVGPAGTEPGAGWTFTDAVWSGKGGDTGNDDAYQAALPSNLPAGEYAWCFRFSLGGDKWLYADRDATANGYSPDQAGGLTVEAPVAGLAIFGIAPSAGPTAGGTLVTLTGQEFGDGAEVRFGTALATDVQVMSASTITAVSPPGAAGMAAVSVTLDNETVTAPIGFMYGDTVTPTLDGVISEWPEASKMATDTTPDAWANNGLGSLYLGYDADNLYLAVSGEVEVQNVLAIYIDVDAGAGTGQVPAALVDSDGDFDNALSSSAIPVGAPGFGAEFGVGGFGGSNVGPGELVTWGGLRGLADPANFAWLSSQVVWGQDGVEMAIPRSVLGLVGGSQVGIFVKIVNDTGDYAAPYGLPTPASSGSMDEVVTLWVP